MTKTLVVSLFLVWGAVGIATPHEKIAPVLALGEELAFKLIQDKAGASFLVTGINFKKRGNLMVSPVNPVAGTGVLNEVYGSAHRPMTWFEASEACAGLKTAGLEWSLPRIQDLRRLSDLTFEKFIAEGVRYRPELGENFLRFSSRGSQYKYLWSGNRGPLPEGLQPAFKMVERPVAVAHTKHKPLQYVCVAYYKAPGGEE